MREKYGDREVIKLLEVRDNDISFKQWKAKGFLTICGHTPKIGEIEVDENLGMLRIDAGCSMNGKLALYCIEDKKLELLDQVEKEEMPKKEGKSL